MEDFRDKKKFITFFPFKLQYTGYIDGEDVIEYRCERISGGESDGVYFIKRTVHVIYQQQHRDKKQNRKTKQIVPQNLQQQQPILLDQWVHKSIE